MAEDKEELPLELECPVCKEGYSRGIRNPLCLPCGHTTCDCCVKELPSRKCAICRMQFPEVCPVNFALLEVLDFVIQLSKSKRVSQADYVAPVAESKVLCEESHAHGSASVFCQQCGMNLCGKCNEQAHTLNALRNHVRTSPKDKKSMICITHQEPLKYFCDTHQCKICRDCRDFGQHKSCKLQLMADIEEKNRQITIEISGKIAQAEGEVLLTQLKSSSCLSFSASRCASALKLVEKSEKKLLESMNCLEKMIANDQLLCLALDPAHEKLSDDVKHLDQETNRLVGIAHGFSASTNSVRESVLSTYFGIKKVPKPDVMVKPCSETRTTNRDGRDQTVTVYGNELTIRSTDPTVMLIEVVVVNTNAHWFIRKESRNSLGDFGKFDSRNHGRFDNQEWSVNFMEERKKFNGRTRILTNDGWSEWVQFSGK